MRLLGCVAELEEPAKGGFWLCPKPVEGDEAIAAASGDRRRGLRRYARDKVATKGKLR